MSEFPQITYSHIKQAVREVMSEFILGDIENAVARGFDKVIEAIKEKKKNPYAKYPYYEKIKERVIRLHNKEGSFDGKSRQSVYKKLLRAGLKEDPKRVRIVRRIANYVIVNELGYDKQTLRLKGMAVAGWRKIV